MVIKGFGTVNQNEQVGEKGFNKNLYIFVAVVIGIFLIAAFVWSNMPLANTVTKNIQTTTEASTGAANPSQANNAGQETSTDLNYQPKFNPNGGATYGDVTWQEMTFNNIPKSIPLAGGLVIRDLKIENDYFYGYVKNPANEERSLDRITFAYLDKNGMATRYSTKVEISAYNSATKEYMWVGAGDIPAGQEFYFRASTMKKYDTGNEIKFLQIHS